MEFHDYVTTYERYRRECKAEGRKKIVSMEDVTRMMTTRMMEGRGEYANLDWRTRFVRSLLINSECDYVNNGRPYYRLYPRYVNIFMETDLEVPLKYIRLPFGAFSIRFAKGFEPVYSNIPVEAILVGNCRVQERDITTLVIGLRSRDPHSNDPTEKVVTTVLLQWGNDYDDWTLKEFLKTKRQDLGRLPELSDIPSNAILDSAYPLYSIVLSVCFLATNMDSLIEPDVLNKHFQSYLEAVNCKDEVKIKEYHDVATRKRESLGFTIGRSDEHKGCLGILGRKGSEDEDGPCGGEGRALESQHLRKGHLHKYWVGPGREKLVVKWIPMLTVRPDLPLPATERRRGIVTPVSDTVTELHNTDGEANDAV